MCIAAGQSVAVPMCSVPFSKLLALQMYQVASLVYWVPRVFPLVDALLVPTPFVSFKSHASAAVSLYILLRQLPQCFAYKLVFTCFALYQSCIVGWSGCSDADIL
jgi:hypothetical protein